jgi:hypothetical protein
MSQSFHQRLNQHLPEQASKGDTYARLNQLFDRLLEAIPVEPPALTDEEALAMLSTDATLMFAESQPCWMEKVKKAGAGE